MTIEKLKHQIQLFKETHYFIILKQIYNFVDLVLFFITLITVIYLTYVYKYNPSLWNDYISLLLQKDVIKEEYPHKANKFIECLKRILF